MASLLLGGRHLISFAPQPSFSSPVLHTLSSRIDTTSSLGWTPSIAAAEMCSTKTGWLGHPVRCRQRRARKHQPASPPPKLTTLYLFTCLQPLLCACSEGKRTASARQGSLSARAPPAARPASAAHRRISSNSNHSSESNAGGESSSGPASALPAGLASSATQRGKQQQAQQQQAQQQAQAQQQQQQQQQASGGGASDRAARREAQSRARRTSTEGERSSQPSPKRAKLAPGETTCPECGKHFPQSTSLYGHLRIHSKNDGCVRAGMPWPACGPWLLATMLGSFSFSVFDPHLTLTPSLLSAAREQRKRRRPPRRQLPQLPPPLLLPPPLKLQLQLQLLATLQVSRRRCAQLPKSR